MVTGESRPSPRAYATFALLAIAFAMTVGWVIARERLAEWRRTEARFHDLARQVRPYDPDTGPRGLQQIWLPDLGRTDRCVTCHRAAEDPDFRTAPQPFTAHPARWLETHPPDRFGCTSCHGGEGDATTYAGAAHRARPHWPTPMRPAPLLEAGCGTCHRERRPSRAPALAAGRDLLARSGCVGCHDIPGFRATDVQAPRLDNIGRKLRQDWLRRYLVRPAVLPGARMPDFRLSKDETDALVAFLSAQREIAPLEANGVDWSRADPARGRELFARARCVTCHRVDERGGTVGPDLSSIGSRVGREWLWSYISDPHREQPDTLMPRFRFAGDDLRDVVAYLSTELVDPAAPAVPPAPGVGNAEAVTRGRRTFIRRGCFGCHRFADMRGLAKIGPSLAGIGDRPIEPADFLREPVTPTLPNWLYLKLEAPERMTTSTSLMPTFALDDRTRVSAVLALLSLTKRELPGSRVTNDPAVPEFRPQGAVGAILSSFRCLSCHQVGGFGGQLSTVALDRIGSQLQPQYFRSFLLDPVAVRLHLEVRMPRLNLTPAEADTVVDYASRVFVDDALERWPEAPEGAGERGRLLYEKLGCRACHTIDRQGGYVGPDLTNAGRRLKPGWVQAWLLTPSRWKPETIQPDYGLSGEEAQALAVFLTRRSPGSSTWRSGEQADRSIVKTAGPGDHGGLRAAGATSSRGDGLARQHTRSARGGTP